ncbi:MAG: single-stranded DNA-binding protein [Candidatus Aminicenantes bacterium]|nr:single-stranded DNA-binding protein [Candidatus Aminicenantes bacterium]
MRDINSLNKVLLIGRLGQNPELRYLPQTERAVAKFSLATNERYFNPSTNESVDRTEWHRIVVWGKLAEFCEKYLNQGKQIMLEGKLRTRNWQDKDGNKRYTTEIEAQNIILLGKKEDTVEEGSYSKTEATPDFPKADDTSPADKEGEEEDEVPF